MFPRWEVGAVLEYKYIDTLTLVSAPEITGKHQRPFEMSSRPEKINGGCLCGEIRYTINIPSDFAWPPERVSFFS